MISVAIDGPVGAGKSTVARECAKRLGFLYVDTGALYRACALACVMKKVRIAPENEEEIRQVLEKITLALKVIDGTQHVLLDGQDVSGDIRTPEISMEASHVAVIPFVRQYLLDQQRNIAKNHDVIMDGRDIGTVILPNAQVKIFITADPKARAKRRYDELLAKSHLAKGADISYDAVLSDLMKRDYQDTHREESPLVQAKDAVLLDTTTLDFEATVKAVIALINGKRGI